MKGRRLRTIAIGIAGAHVLAGVVGWSTRAWWLPHAISDAPNAGKPPAALVRTAEAATARNLRVEVGPPDAELSVAVIDPPARPRGTIIALHGIRDSKRSLMALGHTFTSSGYRAVLVDLRGHGESTGNALSFGARDGHDLVQVVDRLAADGLLALPLGTCGFSYGGAAALQLARNEPRVTAVVTVATFTRMRDIVPLYAERMAPSWIVSRADIDRAIDRAGQNGGFDPDEADSVKAIAATKAPVLLVHGRADRHIPWEHAATLHDAAKDHSELLLIDGKTHGTIMGDEAMNRAMLAWFNRHLGGSPN